MVLNFLAATVAIIAAGAAQGSEPVLHPFPVDWSAPADSPASMAFLLDAPAGKHGFVRIAAGHLVDGSGKRFRIWGVNATARATVPSRKAAGVLAAHLARCGVNCVRFHFLDRPAPQGLIAANRDNTQALDPAQLDRLDYFIAQLKQRGIYTNLNLNVGRTYKAGDRVLDHELLGYAKGLTYFDPRLLELQRQYARQLLTHRNPYTGNEYRNEPAVAIVELVNENSIVESWFSGRLLGKNTRKNPGTWTDIPASYERALTGLYNQWLRVRLSSEQLARLRQAAGVPADAPIPRLRPEEFAKAPRERFHTEAAFYMELERRYFAAMARFLREDLGVKSLLVGTADHNHGRSGYPLLSSLVQLDVIDGHVYWQHPRYIEDPVTGRRKGFEIPNTPMVNQPERSTVVQLSRTAVAGKPYTVSEVNHPFPHEYACEGIPILAAYAALHDWDGVFWYTLAHEPLGEGPPKAIGHFDLGPDPVKMTQIAACAAVFLRPDVRAAQRTVFRSYSREQTIESLRLPRPAGPYFTPGFPHRLPLVHATRIESLDGPPTDVFPAVSVEPIVSDTGEIRWSGAEAGRGRVALDTPRSQFVAGFVRDSGVSTRNLVPEVQTEFCSVTLHSLEALPISRASRLLLTATARVANTGQKWDARRRTLTDWGGPPACIEPVAGAVLLRGLAGVKELHVQPLDGAGRPLGQPRTAARHDGGWRVALGEPPTTWYLITASR